MPKIIVIGSATRDIFIDAENLKKGKNLCFPFGEKTEIQKVRFFSGGGGINAATTFVLQGLKTGFCGIVGKDLIGTEIIRELKEKRIDTSLLKIKKNKVTDLGMIFHAKKERTIILSHNASKSLSWQDIDFKKLKNTDWIYLAPLWGKAAKLTLELAGFAKKNKIKIAFNPSLDQLKQKNIGKILSNIDVLILNDDEALFLISLLDMRRPTKRSVENRTCDVRQKVFQKIASLTKAIVIITKGKDGALAFDSKFLYHVPAQKTKVVDATGAGDSFGAGFVAGLIKENSMEKALILAMSNAIANIRVVGANQGLLKKNEKLPKIKITKKSYNKA